MNPVMGQVVQGQVQQTGLMKPTTQVRGDSVYSVMPYSLRQVNEVSQVNMAVAGMSYMALNTIDNVPILGAVSHEVIHAIQTATARTSVGNSTETVVLQSAGGASKDVRVTHVGMTQ